MSEFSPADIIGQLLIDLGIGASSGRWKVFISIAQNQPDDALILYDTAGTKDGRLMVGTLIIHPGVQIRIRGQNYRDTWNKAVAISQALSGVLNAEVALESGLVYSILNVTQTGDIQPLGLVQEGDRNNHNFTINLITTIQKG